MNGNVRTDQEIVQEALRRLHARDGWVHSSENQLRADAVAALGRLQEQLAAAEAERDTAIQEREEWKRQWERAATWDPATEARLERVEAAATMLLEAVAHEEVITGDTLGAWTSLRAALSDVTPPPRGSGS